MVLNVYKRAQCEMIPSAHHLKSLLHCKSITTFEQVLASDNTEVVVGDFLAS